MLTCRQSLSLTCCPPSVRQKRHIHVCLLFRVWWEGQAVVEGDVSLVNTHQAELVRGAVR